jgi:POT family proton-dependent oligopeptide transporter
MIPEPSEGTPVTTNPVYSRLFVELGCGSLAVGVALVVLVPFLRKLIKDEEAPPAPPEESIASRGAAA